MKPFVVCPTLVLSLLIGCGSGGAPLASSSPTFDNDGNPWIKNISTPVQGPVLLSPGEPEAMVFEEIVDHPYFPLEAGMLRVFEGTADGQHRRDDVRTLDEPRLIEGAICTAVLQEVYLDGELSEVTTEWFAQDAQGNVWKFGEESIELEDGAFERSADSWVAGEDGARPWLLLAAKPEVGDLYVGNRPDGEDRMHVLSITATADVPIGAFLNCLHLHENPDDPEDSDIILVAPNVGMVSEASSEGTIELVSVVDERTSR